MEGKIIPTSKQHIHLLQETILMLKLSWCSWCSSSHHGLSITANGFVVRYNKYRAIELLYEFVSETIEMN